MLVKFEGVQLDVHQSKEHEWLLETSLVAKGYGVENNVIVQNMKRRKEDLIEGKHYVIELGDQLSPNSKKRGRPNQIFWTKKGVVRLGFILRCEKAKLFRDWAEDFIIEKQNHSKVILEKFQEFSEIILAENEQLKQKLDHYEKQLVIEGFKPPLISDTDEYNPLNIAEYYTVKDFLTKKGKEVDINSIMHISIEAKRISKESGYHVMFKPNTRYGKVNFYHSSVIVDAFYSLTQEFIH